MYKILQTREAENDLENLVVYMVYSLKNDQAARNFLNQYEKQIQNLRIFPLGYRGVGFMYSGYEIRIKPFLSYNIFFVVDANTHQITILRVLKNLQNWKSILFNENKYSF